MIYNKLVRDRIPEIIRADGKEPVVLELSEKRFLEEVKNKLAEEFREYESATTDQEAVEELADLLELIYALAETHGCSPSRLELIRWSKAKRRGGFSKKLFLVEVRDTQTPNERR